MAKLDPRMKEFLLKHIGKRKVRIIEASDKDLRGAMKDLGYSIVGKSRKSNPRFTSDFRKTLVEVLGEDRVVEIENGPIGLLGKVD